MLKWHISLFFPNPKNISIKKNAGTTICYFGKLHPKHTCNEHRPGGSHLLGTARRCTALGDPGRGPLLGQSGLSGPLRSTGRSGWLGMTRLLRGPAGHMGCGILLVAFTANCSATLLWIIKLNLVKVNTYGEKHQKEEVQHKGNKSNMCIIPNYEVFLVCICN